MNKRITLHIGLPKTGSTTLQTYFSEQSQKLRAAGTLYPGLAEHEAHGQKRHRVLFSALTGRVGRLSSLFNLRTCREAVNYTFSEFYNSDFNNLLWSHEGLSLAAGDWDAEYIERLVGRAPLRIVVFLRYTDKWVESRIAQMIWAHAGPAKAPSQSRPMRPVLLSEPQEVVEGPRSRGRQSRTFIGQGKEVIAAMRAVRERAPGAEVIVKSFDDSVKQGALVSDALSAIGFSLDGDFADADREAASRNTTIPSCWTMLLYQLGLAQAESRVIHEIARAAALRHQRSIVFAPMAARRFRFLRESEILQLRGDYERLRQDHPELPVQPPLDSTAVERRLAADDAITLLEWLRPAISDETLLAARAAVAGASNGTEDAGGP